jgi:hypothetical protein
MKEFAAVEGFSKGGPVLTPIVRIREFCDEKPLEFGLLVFFFLKKEKSRPSIQHFHRVIKSRVCSPDLKGSLRTLSSRL